MNGLILTFHFAHNYGAVLQAYSLQEYLIENGLDVKILNFTPKDLRGFYSLNPFNTLHIKLLLKQIAQTSRRIKQYKKFIHFQTHNLKLTEQVFTEKNIKKIAEKYDVLVVGSDQIWNEKITGEISTYYGDFCNNKISYAGSFGTNTLTTIQNKNIKKYLNNFHALSVREENAVELIYDNIRKKSTHVVDPVFLQPKKFWESLADESNIKIDKEFVLYYSLKDNHELIKRAENLAQQSNYKLLIIHPTCSYQKVNGNQLYNVGPKEFLWLISNAKYICTNSFHATAFSIIFKKKTIHIPYSTTESRVESLLNKVYGNNLPWVEKSNCKFLDFNKNSSGKFDDWINESKEFLIKNSCRNYRESK